MKSFFKFRRSPYEAITEHEPFYLLFNYHPVNFSLL